MNLKKLNNELNKLYNGKVKAIEENNSRILSGELDNYDDILNACNMASVKYSTTHVVNHIVLKNSEPIAIKEPTIKDNSLDETHVDFLIIGGGISGSSILRELMKWNVSALLIDKEADLAKGASSRNDGEIHPGVDLNVGSLKQKYVVRGNRMYDKLTSDLDVPFKRVGQYACFKEWYLKIPSYFFALQRRIICKVDDTRVVSKKKLEKIEPNLNKDFSFAIYNKMAGIVSPYELTFAYAENAIENGAKVSLNTCCLEMEVKDNNIISVKTNRGTIYPKVVINASGVYSDIIARYANDEFFSIHPRKGTICITDKKANYILSSIASYKKQKKNKNEKNTKGGGIVHTIHDNLLVGPTAKEIYEREDYSTDISEIKTIYDKQKKTSSLMNERDIITYFSGVRASTFEEDFIIERGRNTKNIVHCAGIQSPGLTTAPAVSLDVSEIAINILKEKQNVEINKSFNPKRKGIPHLNEMTLEERNKLIQENSDYGIIVCRCEEISKGEIIDALNSPLSVPTIDGIKKRVRPGMGRCQGGFCMPLVAKIIAEHKNIPLEKVLKDNNGSEIGSFTKGETDYE